MATETDVDVLRDAISDAQETIRAYDLKAEILTAVMTLLVAMVAFAWHDVDTGSLKYLEITIIITTFVTMGCLAATLSPANNPLSGVTNGTYTPKGVYYLSAATLKKESVSDIAKKIKGTNWTSELAFELVKVSNIRERKNHWFRWAIRAYAATFVLLLILCLARYA